MKRLKRKGVLFCLTAAIALTSALLRAADIQAIVTAVHDGDTFTARDHITGQLISIRLFGVDAPELKQKFGVEAQRYTSDMLLGNNVVIEAKGKSYQRIVGKVTRLMPGWTHEFPAKFEWKKTDFNLAIASAGWAMQDKRYSHDPAVASAEADAQSNHRGIWASPNPLPPWEYRRGLSTTTKRP